MEVYKENLNLKEQSLNKNNKSWIFYIIGLLFIVGIVWWLLFGNLSPISVNKKYQIGNKGKYPHEFEVNDDLPCPECAADMLAEINSRNQKLITYLNNKYANRDNLYVKRLNDRYVAGNIVETTPDGGRNTSYTINKGQRISLCVRDTHTKKLHDINLLMYVDIHELGHLAVDTWGHNEAFQQGFGFLLRNAVEIGIWTPVDYSLRPMEYCGITVNKTISY